MDFSSLLDLFKAKIDDDGVPDFGRPNGGITDISQQLASAPADATISPDIQAIVAATKERQASEPKEQNDEDDDSKKIEIPKKREVKEQQDDDSDDEDDEQSKPSKSSSAPIPQPNKLIELGKKFNSLKNGPITTTPTQSITPSSNKNALAMLLSQNLDELKKAQDQKNSNQFLTLLGQSGNTLGNAFLPESRTKVNDDFYNKLGEIAENPVNDVIQKQALRTQLLKTAGINNKLDQDQQSNDPNSPQSIAARNLFEKTTGQKADPNLSAASIKNLQDQAFKVNDAEQSMANRKQIAEENIRDRQDRLQQQKEIKSDSKQNQALNQTEQLLESARGNPEVQQALKDRYAASKAKAIIDSQYDPNNLTPTQVSLLASEVAKIAQGGVPSEGEMQALTPQTLNTKLAGIKQKLLGAPTPANAGEFVKQYKDYLNELNSNANDVINDKLNRVIETRKPQLGNDNYNALKEQYIKSLTPIVPKINVKSHPDDSAAIAWAKANPGPKADAILKANGLL